MIRKLKKKDAPYMMEWMQDKTITCYFKTDFINFSMENVMDFINNSFNEENQHFAIVDKDDNYLGTISLKNISVENRNAEYAIVIRKSAQNKGIGMAASRGILTYAFRTLKLEKVYLNVLACNMNAIAMYEKLGFIREGLFIKHYRVGNIYHDICWYAIYKENFK